MKDYYTVFDLSEPSVALARKNPEFKIPVDPKEKEPFNSAWLIISVIILCVILFLAYKIKKRPITRQQKLKKFDINKTETSNTIFDIS